jgi:hypothetical protein
VAEALIVIEEPLKLALDANPTPPFPCPVIELVAVMAPCDEIAALVFTPLPGPPPVIVSNVSPPVPAEPVVKAALISTPLPFEAEQLKNFNSPVVPVVCELVIDTPCELAPDVVLVPVNVILPEVLVISFVLVWRIIPLLVPVPAELPVNKISPEEL